MKIFKVFLLIIAAILALVLLVVLFFVITEYKPDDIIRLDSEYESTGEKSAPGGIRILSWNLGYTGLDKSTDFFLEGGTSTERTPLSRQRENLDNIIDFIGSQEADVCFIQEVDTSSQRSYKVDQLYTLASRLTGYEVYYGLNYKSPFVPSPVKFPIGKVESGLTTMSRFAVEQAERHQLPGSFSWPVKIFHLKRCLLVSRIPSPVENKYWYLINLHISAYDDGSMRAQQLEYIKELITALYEDGHYVVAGGDWNSLFPGVEKDSFGSYTTDEEHLFWLQKIPDGWTPADWQWCYDKNVPTARSLDQPYVEGENFTTIIDGFLVSPNLRVDEVKGYNLRFEYSDHNPVAVTVSIR